MPIQARNVAHQLTALGATLPKGLAEALEILDAAIAFEPAEPADLNREALTIKAKDVPKLLSDHVESIIRKDTAHRARGELIDRLERRADRAMVTATDEILTSLTDVFTTAARAFEDAYRRLPNGWQDDSNIVRAGTDALKALTDAQEQLPTLEACKTIHRSLTPSASPIENGTALTTVTDTMVATEVAAQKTNGSLGWFGNALAVNGCTGLAWYPTLDEHRGYLATLAKAEMKDVAVANNGFGGVQRQKVIA